MGDSSVFWVFFTSDSCRSCGDFPSHYSLGVEEETKKPHWLSCCLRKAWFLPQHLYVLNHCWCYLEIFSNYEDRHWLFLFLGDKFLGFFHVLVKKNWSLTSVDLGARPSTNSNCKDQGINGRRKNNLCFLGVYPNWNKLAGSFS